MKRKNRQAIRRANFSQKDNKIKQMKTAPHELQSCHPFIKSCTTKVLCQNLKNLYGKHNPVQYKHQYNFKESWESSRAKPQLETKYTTWKNQSKTMNCVQIGLLLCFMTAIWCLSTYRSFNASASEYLIIFIMIGQSIEIVLWQVQQKKQNANEQFNWKKKINQHIFSILQLLYLAFVLVETYIIESRSLWLLGFDLVFVIKNYKRSKQLYMVLKMRMPSHWINEIEITQLIARCLALAHFASVILYLAAQTDTSNNWTQNVKHMKESWVQDYFFSLYFACTTMFTVGYGDITPRNNWQILSILFIQIIGVINSGYIISELGRYLSKINQHEDQLYQDISHAQKLTKSFNLREDLSQKMLSNVINNQIASEKLNVEEEDSFLRKLNQQVRQQVTTFNKFQLVKANIFFICHWSKKFQRNIAEKLIRQVYSPDEVLSQIKGRQRLYILSQGKVDIEANFVSRQRPMNRKKLNTLEIKPGKQVHFNVFGYSAMASRMKVNLRAVSRDYSICFYIDRQNFLSIAEQNKVDFEYFHEIRSRVEESSFKQVFQAPILKSTKEHYIPNPYFIVKRQAKNRKCMQPRKNMMRRDNKGLFVMSKEDSQTVLIKKSKDRMRVSVEAKLSLPIQATTNNMKQSEKNKNSLTKVVSIVDSDPIMEQNENQKQSLIEGFEIKQDYTYFRKKFNPTNMIKKYNIVCHKNDSDDLSSLIKTTLRFKSMGQDALLRILNSSTF